MENQNILSIYRKKMIAPDSTYLLKWGSTGVCGDMRVVSFRDYAEW
jgi:hypothetical protein